jgi:two-component system NarL family response regulator
MAVRAMDPGEAQLQDFDVAVADLRGGLDLLDAVRRRPAHTRSPRVAIVASSDLEWQIRQAVEWGAAAYLLLGATGEELVGAVRSVHAGGCHLSPSIAAKLAQSLAAEPLTAREEQVLALVTEGLCNKRVAQRLDIGVGTVKTHLRAAFDKLQVGSRAQAVVMAKRRGILRHASTPTGQMPARRDLPLGGSSPHAPRLVDRSPAFDASGPGT